MPSPNCRLFLVAPFGPEPARLAACLSAALAAGDAASLLVDADPDQVRELMPIAHAQDVAVLIGGDAALARELDADGVQVAASRQDYATARARIGDSGIVGADCGGDRHAAMELAEAGADYVMLDPNAQLNGGESLIAWWADVMEVPCIAAGASALDDITRLAHQGADFIRPSDAMWQSPEHATQVVTEANRAIAEATG